MIATVLHCKDPNLKKHGLALVRMNDTCLKECEGCKGCGVFFRSNNANTKKDILVKDPFNSPENKIVNIELEDGAILKISFFLFLLPLILFFILLSIGMFLKIHPVIIFTISLVTWVVFYMYLKKIFKYKTYYFITEIKKDTIQ